MAGAKRGAVVVAPSILSADHARLGAEIAAVEAAGADWIHVDVMDGHFVPNLTLGPPLIASLRRATALPLDVHLMIEAPERSLEQYAAAGANRLTVHVEASVHLHRTLSRIRELGVSPGVTLNPSTPAEAIAPVLHLVDLVLVMTVNPGFGGQEFLAEVVPKIAAIKRLLGQRAAEVYLEVDGGVSPRTVGAVAAAGANAFVAGAAIFKSDDYRKAIAALRAGAARARRR